MAAGLIEDSLWMGFYEPYSCCPSSWCVSAEPLVDLTSCLFAAVQVPATTSVALVIVRGGSLQLAVLPEEC